MKNVSVQATTHTSLKNFGCRYQKLTEASLSTITIYWIGRDTMTFYWIGRDTVTSYWVGRDTITSQSPSNRNWSIFPGTGIQS